MPNSPNKFTSLLKHHRIHLEVVWVNNKAVRGIKTQWQDFKAFPTYLKDHFSAPAAAAAPTSAKKPAAKKAKAET